MRKFMCWVPNVLCKTIYYADHESSGQNDEGGGGGGGGIEFYLNNAKYLKVWWSVWIDCVFFGGVINAMYQFHTSTSAFVEFWNDTFWSSQTTQSRKISRRQIWHTFIQGSVRTVAKSSGVTLEMDNGMSIEHATKEAFVQLGEDGVVSATKATLVLNALMRTKKLLMESPVMTLLLCLVLIRIMMCLLL
jgi:hypothetical protein